MKAFLAFLNQQLATLPSVAVTTIKLAILDFGTLGLTYLLTLRHPGPDATTYFNSWLTALCVLHGTGTTAFGIAKLKGNTNAPMSDTAEYPAVVSPAAPAAPAVPPPVATVSAVTTTTVPTPRRAKP